MVAENMKAVYYQAACTTHGYHQWPTRFWCTIASTVWYSSRPYPEDTRRSDSHQRWSRTKVTMTVLFNSNIRRFSRYLKFRSVVRIGLSNYIYKIHEHFLRHMWDWQSRPRWWIYCQISCESLNTMLLCLIALTVMPSACSWTWGSWFNFTGRRKCSRIQYRRSMCGGPWCYGETWSLFYSLDLNIIENQCGMCFYYCRRGQSLLCENFEGRGVTMSGGFAEYVVLCVISRLRADLLEADRTLWRLQSL